jgi:hypothetical protein
MSTISASGIGQSLLQQLQQLSTSSQADTSTTSPSTAGTPKAAGHHHHHRGNDFQKIQDAVTTALQSAQSSGNSTDPNKVIESAIAQVLGGPNAAANAANATGATSTQPTFAQTLQSFGVNPQQFHNDFLAAVQDAQGGQTSQTSQSNLLSNVLQNFGLGSVLDTTG